MFLKWLSFPALGSTSMPIPPLTAPISGCSDVLLQLLQGHDVRDLLTQFDPKTGEPYWFGALKPECIEPVQHRLYDLHENCLPLQEVLQAFTPLIATPPAAYLPPGQTHATLFFVQLLRFAQHYRLSFSDSMLRTLHRAPMDRLLGSDFFHTLGASGFFHNRFHAYRDLSQLFSTLGLDEPFLNAITPHLSNHSARFFKQFLIENPDALLHQPAMLAHFLRTPQALFPIDQGLSVFAQFCLTPLMPEQQEHMAAFISASEDVLQYPLDDPWFQHTIGFETVYSYFPNAIAQDLLLRHRLQKTLTTVAPNPDRRRKL